MNSTYTRKNLTACSKSANKPSTSCVRTCQQACNKLLTVCNNLVEINSDLLQGCSNKSDTVMI